MIEPDLDRILVGGPVGRRQPDVTRHLEFRDRLRASDADRDAYARLKHRLAERAWDDINDYAEAKGPLIGEILERARGAAG